MFAGLLGFFRGVPLVGYVITGCATLLLASSITIFFMGRNINSLHEQIGQDESTIVMLTKVANDNWQYANQLEVAIFRCNRMRTSTDANSLEATEEFLKESKEQYLASDSRRDGIDEEIKDNPAGCGNLPSRATELLIEAANSANSTKDGDDS